MLSQPTVDWEIQHVPGDKTNQNTLTTAVDEQQVARAMEPVEPETTDIGGGGADD